LRPGSDHQVALAHQLGGRCLRHRRRQDLHEVARRADARELLVHEALQQCAGAPSLGAGRDDDGIARCQRIDDLVGWCSGRVGRRRDGAHHADRPRDLDDAGGRIVGDDTHRRARLQVAQQPEGLAVVLADLVLHHADTGIGHRQFGERTVAARLENRPGCRRHQVAHAGLVVAVGDPLRGACPRQQVRYLAADRRIDRGVRPVCCLHLPAPVQTTSAAARHSHEEEDGNLCAKL
jgi:hypothetical protein